jgi:hypothetical protein
MVFMVSSSVSGKRTACRECWGAGSVGVGIKPGEEKALAKNQWFPRSSDVADVDGNANT